ncbi:MAG: LysM peptidoglycan-binding domain-containing protein [Syntrophales bacterium]
MTGTATRIIRFHSFSQTRRHAAGFALAGGFASPPMGPDRRDGKDGLHIRKSSGAVPWGTAVIALALLLCPPLVPQAFPAREDSASLVLRKSAGQHKTRLYVVKKGDFLSDIFRRQMGDEPVPTALIRQLNPGIRDLNRIYPGQRLVLPVRRMTELPESSTLPIDSTRPVRAYRIQEDDSISRIILAELNTSPGQVLSAYRLLRQLNPEIENLNNLPPGEMLKLPADSSRPESTPAPLQAAAPPEEKPQIDSAAAPQPPNAEGFLGLIRPVISRMKGAITAEGNYYIPLKDTAQVTIDCSLIPVVELDDGSTVLLDFGNRLSENLRRMITQSWPNYAFLSADELRDDLVSLQSIIRRSRNYTIAYANRPLAVTAKPEILAFPDWVIAGKRAVGGALYRQGLFLLGENEHPFPAEALAFMEKNGLIVTEITAGSAVTPPPPPSTPVMLSLKDLRGVALAEQLLRIVGETPVRNAGIVIFDQAKDGFNLAITADLLVKKGDKRFLILTRRLPDQLVRTLKDEGTEVFQIREQASGRSLIEELLQRLDIPIAFGHFSIRIPEEGPRPRLAGTFSGLRTTTAGGETLYLVDFDVSPELLSLLQGRLGGRFARY